MNTLLAIPTFIETGVLKIATVDIVVLVCLLIAVIVGYAKGFMKQILSILGLLASIVLAVVFCDDLADYIIGNVPVITDGVKGMVSSLFGSVLGDSFSSHDALISALEQSKIPAFLHEMIASLILDSGFSVKILDVLTKWALNVICFVGIIVISSLLFIIVKILFKFITKIPLIKSVDKTLGIVFSVLKTLIIIMVVFSVLSIFTDINQYLVPGEGVTCVFNSVMEMVLNLPFIKNLFS